MIFQTINEQGFSTALMYKQNRDNLDYSTVFWSNIFISILSYLLIYYLSGFASVFFNSPPLENVIKLMGFNLIIQAFYIIPNTIFIIKLDFKTQAKASLCAAIISGTIGIICAYLLRNVYAIVIQAISYQLLYAIMLYYILKWIPSLQFSVERFKVIFFYGYKLIVSRIISVLFDDIYTFGIGKVYSSGILGLYNRANTFRVVFSNNLVHVFQRVSMPMLCAEQNSKEKMCNILLRFIASTSLIVYPILVGMMILAKPMIVFLLTDEWIEVANILQFVCPIGFFYLISTFCRNLYNSTGRTDLALRVELIKKLLFVLILFIFIQFSFKIFLISHLFICFLEMLIDVSYGGKLVGLNLFKILYTIRKILFSTLIMSIVLSVYKCFIHGIYVQLFGGFILGVCVYFFSLKMMCRFSFKEFVNGHINIEKLI